MALAIAAAFLGACALVFLWFEHRAALTLPAPSGPFHVSRLTEVWTDEHRPDSLVDSPGTRTELVVWIWFPSTSSPNLTPAEYMPAAWRRAVANRQSMLMRLLSRDHASVRAHSVVDGPVIPFGPPGPLDHDQRNYPIVILRAGLGALTTEYTTLAEDLASHGYVVVGFDAPYRTRVVVFPDGRVLSRPPRLDPDALTGVGQERLLVRLLHAWTGDIGFVIDRLRQLNAPGERRFGGTLDLQQIAVVGHALGGATAAQFCSEDSRCAAGIDMDGALRGRVVQAGLRRPFMFMLSDHGEPNDPPSRKILADIQSVHDRLPAEGRMGLVIRGADHVSFSDSLLTRSRLARGVMRVTGNYSLEPRRGLAIVAESARRFLDVHLKGAPMSSLQGLAETYPEVQLALPR